MNIWFRGAYLIALLGVFGPCAAQPTRKAVTVKVVKTAEGWQLTRGGQPYFIKGAGGGERLDQLKAAGGNSCRTWGADDKTGELLDRAQSLGLTVTVGIWLGHERHGFKYDDPAMVREQLEKARAVVRKYKDHPAVLLWGLGNEMEGGTGDNPRIWKAVNEVARMVKQEDPNHPTMTVVAEIGQPKVAMLKQHCPDIDILGINSYGGLINLPRRLREQGLDRPFVVTEFGPLGPWEGGYTPWRAPYEMNSREKADLILGNYLRSVPNQPACLGGYVFLWGQKQEATSTWFGMFLADGSRLPVVDAMTWAWSGKWPANRAPHLLYLDLDTDPNALAPGKTYPARVGAVDPDGDAITIKWEVRAESSDRKEGGDAEAAPPLVPDSVVKAEGSALTFRAPQKPGPYRLFVTVYDGKGSAATANVPFLVK